MKRSFWMSAAMVVGLVLLSPSTASANEYLVTSCHDPAGAPNAAQGWESGAVGGGTVANTCAANGVLSAALPQTNPPGDATAGWRFTAPAGTRIVRVQARRATHGFGPSNEPNDVDYVMNTEAQLLERCRPAPDSSCVSDLTAPLDKQGLNAGYVEMRLLCLNVGRTCTRPVSVDATHLYVSLEDAAAPTVTNARTIDDGDTTGTLRVGFDAADVGGGLYRTIIKVDGKVVQSAPLAAAPCTDVNTIDADPFQFNVPVPCPLSVTGASAVVDVKSLPAGPHGVEIAVEDAAGNQSSVFGPIEFPKLNIVAGSSIPAADLIRGALKMWFVKAPNRGTRFTSRLGQRVVTRGVLRTPAGKGIQGARIDVYHLRDGKRRLLKTGLKSRAGGKLTLILPLDVDTRHIQYVYRAVRPGPATSTAKLRLRVLTRNGKLFHRR